MWRVTRDKVVIGQQVVAPYTVGTYRFRLFALCVAWLYAHGWWGCYVDRVAGDWHANL